MHGKNRLIALPAIGLLVALITLSRGFGLFARQAGIAEHLPVNPMIAGVYTIHPAERIDVWLSRMQALTGETMEPWAELDEKVGMSFRDDVLGAFGPQFAFAVDLPSPEGEAGGSAVFDDEMPRKILERAILVAGIRNKLGAIRAAGALAKLAEAELTVDEDRLTISLREPSVPGGTMTLHALVDDDLLVLSGSKERVDEASAGFDVGQRLADGADFAQVVTHVAANPEFLTYFNLPRIRDWIRAAGLDLSMDRMRALLEDEWMGMGLIYTSRRSGAGVEVAHYGPVATAEGLGLLWSGAFLGPMAMIGPLSRLASGSSTTDDHQTMADIRMIATVLESYSIDNSGYPTTAGWETVASIRANLEPDYVTDLPTNDQWGQPYLVWSDGTTYRIVSRGADEKVERDWSGGIEPGSFTDSDSDIVFGDGRFLRWQQR